jgi:Pilus assembly protein, PilO
MKRLHALIVYGAESLGRSGIVGLGLLAFVVGFYFSTFRPQQMRLEELRIQISKLEESRTRAAEEPKSPGDKLNAFYGFLPPSNHIADLLEKIYGAAESQKLKLEQGEYRAVRSSVSRLTDYQVILPIKGTYPQVRKFVATALAEVPNLSLDSIQFERQKVGDSTVDAKVKLVLYLGQRS